MADQDVRDAVAWLATTWRLNSVNGGRDPAAEPPALTSAELSRIEHDAALPVGVLTSLADYLWLSEGHDPAAAPEWVTGPQALADEDLAALLDACANTGGTSADWSRLGWALTAGTTLVEPQALALAESLMRELPRGIKHCYRHHRVASILLATRPEMVAPLVSGIRGCIDNPEGPAFLEPIGLLAQVPDPEARDLVLDLLERPRTPAEGRYAGWLATQLLQRDDFDRAQRSRLAVVLMTQWRRDPEAVVADLGELLEVLPDGVRRMFARAQGRATPPDALPLSDVVGESAALLARCLLAAVDEQGLAAVEPGRAGLTALVELAFCRINSEVRHRAGQVLSASPYRAALASGLLNLLAMDGVDPVVRRRAANGVGNLLDESHRLPLLQLLDDPQDEVVAGLLSALGHVELSVVSDHELRQRLPARRLPWGRSCMYALGMSGSEILPTLAASRAAPAWQRDSAAWWLRVGPAVRT